MRLVQLWIWACRTILRLTRKHGLLTLGRLNSMLFRHGQYVHLPAKGRLFIPPDPHFFGFALGTHEHHITELLTKFIRSGDVCVDVGANIGYFTVIMSRLAGVSGRVVAFEPVPENFAILRQNAEIASGAGAAVTAINAAVSERRGRMRIVRQQYSTYHQVAPIEQGTDAESVPGVCLDEELPELIPGARVSFLKIDVEGHELPVLRGLCESLRSGLVSRLVVEITPGSQAYEIEDLLMPYAQRVDCWIEGAWRRDKISSLRARTDVFINCVDR
jgi:FkbM family methyltransferase